MIYDFEALSFQVLGILKVEHPQGFFKVGGRPYAALSYRVSGSGEFNFGEKRLSSNPGDLLFIPEGVSYDVQYSGGTMLVIHFLDCNYHTPENITLGNNAFIAEKFFDMLGKWENGRSIHSLKASVYEVMQFCYETNSRLGESPLADRAKQLIEKNYQDKNFNIESLCRTLYTSPSTLRRIFTQRFDISPKQYLMKVRLDTALLLLSVGFLSIRDIALQCGFEDEHYFSRLIKNKFGSSPSRISKNN